MWGNFIKRIRRYPLAAQVMASVLVFSTFIAILSITFQLIYDYRVEKEPQKIIDLMFSDETDLRKTVVLEEEPESIKPKVPPKSSPEVTIIDYSPNEVLIGVKTQASGLLFLSDNYFPGWRAFVDNAPAKVYRANYSFRAVEIPEGKHQIKFIYQPGSFQLGATISGASVLFIGLLAVVFGKKYL